ncbi:MAG: signal peptidase II [Chloroflexota bacterium]
MVYLLILLAFLADQLSKRWISANVTTPVELNQWLTLRITYNEGIAFGLFQGIGPIVGWLTIFVLAGMLIYLTQLPKQWWLHRYGLALFIGGGLGNMVDRILFGRVLDFLESSFRPGIFNVADLFIYLGVFFILIGTVVHQEEPQPESAANIS